jgi:UDP-GlcNAc:undecaprenyl-phosphate/decaprenyl-phosphate GlcNAc-1-phosphate transferase
MLSAAAAFLLALAGSWLLTPIIRDAAHGAGLLDEPEERKVHETPIPRLGGVAIGAAFYLGIAAGLVAARATGERLDLGTGHLTGVLVGVALIAGVGLLDDLQGMRARVKLAAQVVVALVAYGLGLSIDTLHGPWGTLDLGPWSLVLTVLWIVALVNAVNLIDGLDGLASGVALTAMIAFFVMASGMAGSDPILMVLAAGAGGVLGFLRYNLHPASIIMGDTGSMQLGFLLAAVSITLAQAPDGPVAFWAPLLALGVPLADMAWAVLRRLAARAPVFAPDKRHIHHQLMAGGLSTRWVVLLLWLVSAALGALAVMLA